MQYIRIIIKPDAEPSLGSGVISFLKRVDHHVDQRIYQKRPQKKKGRQKVQPAFQAAVRSIIFHIYRFPNTLYSWAYSQCLVSILAQQEGGPDRGHLALYSRK